ASLDRCFPKSPRTHSPIVAIFRAIVSRHLPVRQTARRARPPSGCRPRSVAAYASEVEVAFAERVGVDEHHRLGLMVVVGVEHQLAVTESDLALPGEVVVADIGEGVVLASPPGVDSR